MGGSGEQGKRGQEAPCPGCVVSQAQGETSDVRAAERPSEGGSASPAAGRGTATSPRAGRAGQPGLPAQGCGRPRAKEPLGTGAFTDA